MKKLILLAIVSISMFSCSKNDNEDVDTKNRNEIEKYISDNNLNATSTSSGLYYVIDNEGSGGNPTASSSVTVKYKGYFTNGSVFDQSTDAGITFGLQNVIPGWTEGIQLFKKGGTGILLIPSKLAYGSRGTNGIPPNSVLVFDIDLKDFN